MQFIYACIHIHTLDCHTLEQQLKEASTKTMAMLCSNWCRETVTDELNFTCCRIIKPCTQSILTPFSHLARPSRSQIFRRMWKEKMSTFLESNYSITQERVIEFIWWPTVTYCQELVYRLKSGDIPMSEIEEVFRDDKNLTDIQLSCDSLLDSLSCSALVEDSSNREWIHTLCSQIKHYRLSLKCIECAQAIFSLRDKLDLKGDFSRIKVVGDEVTIQLVSVMNSTYALTTKQLKILNVMYFLVPIINYLFRMNVN